MTKSYAYKEGRKAGASRKAALEAVRQTYMFKRNYPDGQTSTLIGAEVQAVSSEDAMRQLKILMGYTTPPDRVGMPCLGPRLRSDRPQ